MIHNDLEFYNIAELNEVPGVAGLRLQRVPEAVRCQLDEGTQGTMLSPANAEIRCVIAEGHETATVTLSSDSETKVRVYRGAFQGPEYVLGKEPRTIEIKPAPRLAPLRREECGGAGFDPRVVRLCFGGPYPEPVFYHGCTGCARVPAHGLVPARSYLAYGSSITHGANGTDFALAYVALAARRLGLDLRNLGASGCCLCEKAMADYLAAQKSCIVSLELSVNMLGRGFTVDEFHARAKYLVETIADADPARPVACITIFPHFRDLTPELRQEKDKATSEEYRVALRDIVASAGRANVHLIEGPELLQDIGGLTADMIHPGNFGMIQMGEELAKRLAALLPYCCGS